MEHFWVVPGIAVVLFVVTNVDDIFVLLAFFADSKFRPVQVVVGQFAGMAALLALSVVGSLISLVVAPAYVGLLGFAPLGLGLWKLWQLRRPPEEEEPGAVTGARTAIARIVAVALVTVANGGDNLGVYIPVFASHPRRDLAAFVTVFLMLTGVWCVIGYRLVHHPRLGRPIRRYARPLTPLVLIALGLFILIESKTYSLLGL